MDHIEKSYALQAESENLMGMPSAYTDPRSIDNWRHVRMRSFAKGMVDCLPQATWMTVGDGRYGSDAAYLASLGADVMATSLTDERLKVAFERGHISKYQIQNAESISCPDSSYDFLFCKEAYHHFPRPPIALYEMLRVAKTGVVLIEPADNSKPLDLLKAGVKRLLRGSASQQFEPSGNFIFRLSVSELAKLMTAMGGLCLAHKPFNDLYLAGVGGHDAHRWTKGRVITTLGIGVQNLLCRLGLMGWGLTAVVLFKGEPSGALREAMLQQGFKVIDLPRNPYV